MDHLARRERMSDFTVEMVLIKAKGKCKKLHHLPHKDEHTSVILRTELLESGIVFRP